MSLLSPVRSRRRWPSWGLGAALCAFGLLAAPWPGAVRAQDEDLDFGRWETDLVRCRLSIRAAEGRRDAGKGGGAPSAPVAGSSRKAQAPTTGGSEAARLRLEPLEPQDCRSLRLDQQIPGLLTLRFIAAGGGSRFASRTLAFAGVLLPGSLPMRCNEGRCDPQGPMRVEIRAVAQSGFDPRGLALGLPQAVLARGTCQVENRGAICTADTPSGEHWQADAAP